MNRAIWISVSFEVVAWCTAALAFACFSLPRYSFGLSYAIYLTNKAVKPVHPIIANSALISFAEGNEGGFCWISQAIVPFSIFFFFSHSETEQIHFVYVCAVTLLHLIRVLCAFEKLLKWKGAGLIPLTTFALLVPYVYLI